jgi:hypothetical protein
LTLEEHLPPRAKETEVTLEELLKAKYRLIFYGLHRENAHAIAQSGLVAVDPSSNVPAAKNLLHELIHLVRPLWSETRVRTWEAKLWRKASWREKAQLYQKLATAKIWEGEDVIPEETGNDGQAVLDGISKERRDPAVRPGN